MKKMLSLIIFGFALIAVLTTYEALAATTYNITPKPPVMTSSLKPIVAKYRKGNYVGAMLDLEDLVKKEKNNTYAKYYLALCYTRLGYKEEAQTVYKEVVKKDDNLTLTHYSQRALDCLENPENEICQPQKPAQAQEGASDLDDMDLFIQSGRKIHPAAMDRITRERMERKLQQDEYLRKQQEADGELKSHAPSNEEIAAALNTLSKIGMNPYTQTNPLLQASQFNQYGFLGNNANMYNPFLNGNSNPDVAKMFLYSQMAQQQNSLMNYGI